MFLNYRRIALALGALVIAGLVTLSVNVIALNVDRSKPVMAASASGEGSVSDEFGEARSTSLRAQDVAEFEAYDLYWLGESFEKLPLRDIAHSVTPEYVDDEGIDSPIPEQNYVRFIYGDCDASDGRCWPPLEIQVWPSCLRNPSMFSMGGQPYPYEPTSVRGVPAVLFDEGTRLEMFTGDVTVVIWGDSTERIIRVAEAVYSASDDSSAHTRTLPRPVIGALEGDGRCPRHLMEEAGL